MLTPDVLIIGLGAMGSATAYQLAKRGAKVIGLDQFAPPHAQGSTHGESRITREAIGEGEEFVPLARRSHQLWREIEAETNEVLLNACGGLILARTGQASHMHAQKDFLGNTIRAAQRFGIPHEVLTAKDIAMRYPQFILQGDESAYFEPGAGYLNPEACVRAQLQLAKRHGADLRLGETVMAIRRGAKGSVVETNRATYAAGTTIVAAGAWLPALMPHIATPLVVRRQVMFWFATEAGSAYSAKHFPIFIWHWGATPDDVFYGFPQTGHEHAIKVAAEQHIASTTTSTVQREVSANEAAAMYQQHVVTRLSGVRARLVRAATCLYTEAPGARFLIDRVPDQQDVIVISACSGHGFKHSAAIGEAVAEMVVERQTPEMLRPFALGT